MKILVTGGAGFIGSHVVDAYISEGHEVVIIDNLSSGSFQQVNPKAKFYLMDIRAKEIDKIIEIERPDVINHHAAQKSVPHSVEDPLNDADINVMGLINLLNCATKYKVNRFIFISSGGALGGDSDMLPTPESHPATTLSPYAITKYVSEKYLNYFQITFGLEYVVLRYANVYGPRQIPDGECGVIPIFMNNILDSKPSRLMTYSDMPKGVTRDYVYVNDIKEANILALTKGANQIFNIGSGEEIHIADIYNALLEVKGVDFPLIRDTERIGDVKRSVLDVTKAKKLLGWVPKTELKLGIEFTYDYIKKQGNTSGIDL